MRRYLSLLLLLFAILTANANPVNQNVAREVGAKFLHASALLKTDNPSNLQLASTYRTANNEAAFYVFNTDKGFVIVAADDCATPILGYSNEGVFAVDEVPIQMEEYLQQFVNQIEYGIANHVTDEATARQWELVRTTGFITEERGTTAVAPLLTDTWGQGCYYNSLCPVDPTATDVCGHTVTGCAATSMAQILHYWGYPTTGTGSHTYTPTGYPQQSVNFGTTTYDWANMPNSLSQSSTTAQVNAVATLMWHCGVAIDMAYGPDGSSAFQVDVAAALLNYFSYSSDLSIVHRSSYSTSEQWLNIMKDCLNMGRPIHYQGIDQINGGHAFVCDGYDNNSYLHFNWGWNGVANGYFADGALNPSGATFSFQYNTNNAAIINIHPNTTLEVNISATPTNAGTVSFGSKDDRTSNTYNFDDHTLMGWTTLDADGDSYNWVLGSNVGGIYLSTGSSLANDGHGLSEDLVVSGSYSNITGVGALTPDNYLISPSKSNYGRIKFYARSQDASYPAEHFGVAVSTTNNTSASAFTTIQEWTLTAKGNPHSGPRGGNREQGLWYEYTADLSAYAGQQIWVAIRHFGCTDQFLLDIDDITLSSQGCASFNYGENCTVTASPNSGYTFTNWTENGTVVSTNANYTFKVNSNRTLVAHFSEQTQQHTVSISANPSNGGTVAFNTQGTSVTTTYNFDNGTMMGWTSLDADGDGKGWVNGSGTEGIYLVTGTGNLAYQGHNSSADLVVSGSYSNVSGALTPNNYLVSPTKNTYSQISFWACGQDANYAAEHFGVAVSTTNANANNFTMVQEWTLTAKGERYSGPRGNNRNQGNWYQFTVDLSAYAGQEIWVAIRHFNCTDQFLLDIDDITLTSVEYVFNHGQSCTVTATPNSGFTFTNWTENGSQVSTNATYTFTVNNDRNLVANFTPTVQQYTINVSANPTNGGSVSGGGTFNQGASCTVTATPNTGYTFTNWTENGSQVSTNANYTFTVNGNRNLVANFALITYNINVTTNPTNGGSVSGGGTVNQGASCTVTATPNTGYTFTNWTENGNQVSTNANYTFTVTGNRNLVANFAQQTFTVSVSANPQAGGIVTGGGTYTYGQTATVSVTVNPNYQFTGWTENGSTVSTNETYSFVVTENHQLVAHLANVTEIAEQNVDNIALFPNPANSNLTIKSEEPITQYRIYDIKGTMVYQMSNIVEKDLNLDVRSLPTGTYMICLTVSNTVLTKKFMKE